MKWAAILAGGMAILLFGCEKKDQDAALAQGQAIVGKAPGATVTYQGPKRELSVTVVAVRPLA